MHRHSINRWTTSGIRKRMLVSLPEETIKLKGDLTCEATENCSDAILMQRPRANRFGIIYDNYYIPFHPFPDAGKN